jgi:hypothetical protein
MPIAPMRSSPVQAALLVDAAPAGAECGSRDLRVSGVFGPRQKQERDPARCARPQIAGSGRETGPMGDARLGVGPSGLCSSRRGLVSVEEEPPDWPVGWCCGHWAWRELEMGVTLQLLRFGLIAQTDKGATARARSPPPMALRSSTRIGAPASRSFSAMAGPFRPTTGTPRCCSS